MKVLAIKLTEDVESTKVAYVKNGKYFIRNGQDGFKKGVLSPVSIESLKRYGFRLVDTPPEFETGEDINSNIHRFSLNTSGSIEYSPY